MNERKLIAAFKKGDRVTWNALALAGDEREDWIVDGMEEDEGLFPIYRVKKGTRVGSAIQTDLERSSKPVQIEVTPVHLDMLDYFWREKRDLSRYVDWPSLQNDLQQRFPAILRAWQAYDASQYALTLALHIARESNPRTD
jgi:hypothetical protein